MQYMHHYGHDLKYSKLKIVYCTVTKLCSLQLSPGTQSLGGGAPSVFGHFCISAEFSQIKINKGREPPRAYFRAL